MSLKQKTFLFVTVSIGALLIVYVAFSVYYVRAQEKVLLDERVNTAHGIIFQEIALSQFIEVARPLLHWSDFVYICDIFQETIGIHFYIDAVLHQRRAARVSPIP